MTASELVMLDTSSGVMAVSLVGWAQVPESVLDVGVPDTGSSTLEPRWGHGAEGGAMLDVLVASMGLSSPNINKEARPVGQAGELCASFLKQ